MRIGIISDTHFGDPRCKLVRQGVPPEEYRAKIPRFKALCECLKPAGAEPLDYLVLNGDTLDFSISEFEDSCRIARPFFQALAHPTTQLAKQIILIPGNHDKQIWDIVEWERHITMKMQNNEDPEESTRTQPGVLRYSGPPFTLPGVSTRPDGTYGGLFLEGLFARGGPSLPIAVVYPNLYIQTPANTYMVTHGHMLEPAWVLLSELLGDYVWGERPLGLHELEEFNIPLTAMVCSGVGQAGPVTDLFRAIQGEAKDGKTDTLKKVLNHVIPKIDDLIQLSALLEWTDNVFLWTLKRLALRVGSTAGNSRYDKLFFEHPQVRQRFERFYRASIAQATDVHGGNLPVPDKVIFGHTHEPIPQSDPMHVLQEHLPGLRFSDLGVKELKLYNTGGWLAEGTASAEVFLFGDDGTLTSQNIP